MCFAYTHTYFLARFSYPGGKKRRKINIIRMKDKLSKKKKNNNTSRFYKLCLSFRLGKNNIYNVHLFNLLGFKIKNYIIGGCDTCLWPILYSRKLI